LSGNTSFCFQTRHFTQNNTKIRVQMTLWRTPINVTYYLQWTHQRLTLLPFSSTYLGKREPSRQFHQRFSRAFFVRKFVQSQTLSCQMQNDVWYVKRWWNWPLSSTYLGKREPREPLRLVLAFCQQNYNHVLWLISTRICLSKNQTFERNIFKRNLNLFPSNR
jgi:hypothetical protein